MTATTNGDKATNAKILFSEPIDTTAAATAFSIDGEAVNLARNNTEGTEFVLATNKNLDAAK